MLSILYPYRNRDSKRLKKSFDSLIEQSHRNFEVYFIDYGSTPDLAAEIKRLCLNYSFISYQFYPTQYQPWNKSRALNSVIKELKTDFCFVADVDIIFHPRFVETATNLMKTQSTTYFQVGYLDPSESLKDLQFQEFSNYRLSNDEATGLSLFPVRQLQELRGFDEFYHFWGAEDTDMHIRLKNAGYKVKFYDDELLLLHQWHPSYRSNETKNLTEDFQIEGIVQLNHQHLKFTEQNKVTSVNLNGWGEIPSAEEIMELQNTSINFTIQNEKRQVDDFLYGQLPVIKDKILKIVIEVDRFQNSRKYKAKKLLRKKVPFYYSLKKVNDLVLLHLISFYRNKIYTYKINPDNHNIILTIKL